MISTVLQPLNNLLSSKVKWKWTTECEDSFQKAKDLIVSNRVLTDYDLNLLITLACDASSFGTGAVISHQFPNGEEKPIAFASKTLNSSQQNFSQLEKEALSIIFGVKKFYQYLYRRQFSLITDQHLNNYFWAQECHSIHGCCSSPRLGSVSIRIQSCMMNGLQSAKTMSTPPPPP